MPCRAHRAWVTRPETWIPAALITQAGAVDERTWSSSACGCRAFAGTNTAPASQTPNMAKTNSGPLGSCTTTAWPGSTPAERSPALDSGGFHACGARRHTQIHGVDQVFTIGEGMCRQQVRQAARGFHHDLALPREGRRRETVSTNGVSAQRRPLTVGRWMKGSDKGNFLSGGISPIRPSGREELYIIFVSADPVRHGMPAPECKESRNGRQWK